MPSTSVEIMEQAISVHDPITSAMYFLIVVLCAPLWEEVRQLQCICSCCMLDIPTALVLGQPQDLDNANIVFKLAAEVQLHLPLLRSCRPPLQLIFRGFLLPSLSKSYAPVAALVASAAIFALAHFDRARVLPLFLLGLLLGHVYMRTRNLLAPVALHSLWNVCVFVQVILQS